LISPCPQPASSKTTDRKAVDVTTILKIFNCLIPELADAENGGLSSLSSRQ